MFTIGTHYYGFKEYQWPVNYLNALSVDDIENDLTKIKNAGFNTIILLVSWSEFEPTIGDSNQPAYNKINKIIETANKHSLEVMLRMPYVWALNGDMVQQRIAYTLLNYYYYKKSFLLFLERFQNAVINNNSNIISKFGSWEDFYVLRDYFFSGEGAVSKDVREAFFRDTGMRPQDVDINGDNYNVLLAWIDSKIVRLMNDLSNYGYEIRTDSDPYTKDNKLLWHSHGDFYQNESEGALVAYWAPYFGQKNIGEKILASQAIDSFLWMLDLIDSKTKQQPFIDQLNFYDNSPDTGTNAKIKDSEYRTFFNKLVNVITTRTVGYAFWTLKDYGHNIIYNTSFTEGLSGWNASDNVHVRDHVLTIGPGNYLSQDIDRNKIRVLNSTSPHLLVNIISGSAHIEIESKGEIVYQFDLPGIGKKEIVFGLEGLEHGFRIVLKPSKQGGQQLKVGWVGLFGHKQVGKIFDVSGNKDEFYSVVKEFNGKVGLLMLDLGQNRDLSIFDANGDWFKSYVKSTDVVRGSYGIEGDAGRRFAWLGAESYMTLTVDESVVGKVLKVEGWVPAETISIATKQTKPQTISIIVRGKIIAKQAYTKDGKLFLSVPWSKIEPLLGSEGTLDLEIKSDKSFIPSRHSDSKDNRNLALVLTSIQFQ